MLTDLDLTRLGSGLPGGIAPGSDSSSLTTGKVVGVDTGNRRVQVSVAGSDGVWVPAAAGVYTVGVRVRLMRSVVDGGRVIFCEGTLDSVPEIVQGRVETINAGAGTLTVSVLGVSVALPYSAGTYSVGTLVHVLRSPQMLGAPLYVLGPQGNFVGEDPGESGGGSTNPPQLVLREKTIVPEQSGSYRSAFSRWDTWNTDRYGGASTLWQGNQYGSGPMTGLATYGDQVVNLSAQSIESIEVAVYRADSSVSSGVSPTLQAATDGTRPGGAPSVAGATVTGPALTPEAGAWVALPTGVLDGFRTGTYKGVATVGSAYGGFSGTSKGDGMLLKIQYKVLA
jgi:hypothetical protein